MSYLSSGIVEKIESGEILIIERRPDGTLVVQYPDDTKVTQPKTVWKMQSHNAGEYGSKLVTTLLPGRKFPFPKSLYAVEDVIGFFVKQKPDAVVLDFFAGSGTTAHAVARLNRQDCGRRQSISVTNNEVSAVEARVLQAQGYRPGDPQWETLGIFEHITRPRLTAAVTGLAPHGEPIKANYRFTDEFSMAEGFEENVEFLELTYLDPEDVELDLVFEALGPLMWLRAGGQGPIIDKDKEATPRPWAWTERYGVLFDCDRWRAFVDQRPEGANTAFVMTDSQSTFTGVAAELPDSADVVRLYENYLTAFGFNQAS